MVYEKIQLLPDLNEEVVENIYGFRLCSYLVALEGWRRGLQLTWYKDETDLCKLDKLNSSTQGKFFSLSNGEDIHYFFRSRGDKVSNKSVRICQNKEKTKEILSENGVPVPKGRVISVDHEEEISNYAKGVKYPVVIKPINGSMGKGVYTNIKNKDELINVVNNLRSEYNYTEYIIEKYYPGKEYRIYVVGDKVVGATRRVPANIVGDGVSTVNELIEMKNMERKKNPYLNPKPIKVDFEVSKCLETIGYTVHSIPQKEEVVYLREKSNLSSGGDPLDATDELTPAIKQIAVNSLKALPSIPHAGVDIIVDPKSDKKGVVLEVNATAEIGFHLFPIKGEARDVPGAIIDYYFPETIGKNKSIFYFNYESTIDPLKSWVTEQVVMSCPPEGLIYGKRYIVSGKLKNVGYMTFIRRQALQKKLNGFTQKVCDGKIEVVVFSESEKIVLDFENTCLKGSKKSIVNNLEVEDINPIPPVKLGFEIR
ncbi:acylphosphatase [Evansella tamaricis]|uniref:Acylphosphatase n=1 Tax=Evansella tamaricis TaxID=2069301 RepID=A0ABS6JH55_9BACI|nr:acylphosphatase [Evansella tamaricis]MBU9712956.1 acylphosphatase [Evansella tamaricis]